MALLLPWIVLLGLVPSVLARSIISALPEAYQPYAFGVCVLVFIWALWQSCRAQQRSDHMQFLIANGTTPQDEARAIEMGIPDKVLNAQREFQKQLDECRAKHKGEEHVVDESFVPLPPCSGFSAKKQVNGFGWTDDGFSYNLVFTNHGSGYKIHGSGFPLGMNASILTMSRITEGYMSVSGDAWWLEKLSSIITKGDSVMYIPVQVLTTGRLNGDVFVGSFKGWGYFSSENKLIRHDGEYLSFDGSSNNLQIV
jgi:hypothetical protein